MGGDKRKREDLEISKENDNKNEKQQEKRRKTAKIDNNSGIEPKSEQVLDEKQKKSSNQTDSNDKSQKNSEKQLIDALSFHNVVVNKYHSPNEVEKVQFNADQTLMAIITSNNRLFLYNTLSSSASPSSWACIYEIRTKGHSKKINFVKSIQFVRKTFKKSSAEDDSIKGSYFKDCLFIGNLNGTITEWDLTKNCVKNNFMDASSGGVWELKWNENQKLFAASHEDGNISILDSNLEQVKKIFTEKSTFKDDKYRDDKSSKEFKEKARKRRDKRESGDIYDSSDDEKDSKSENDKESNISKNSATCLEYFYHPPTQKNYLLFTGSQGISCLEVIAKKQASSGSSSSSASYLIQTPSVFFIPSRSNDLFWSMKYVNTNSDAIDDQGSSATVYKSMKVLNSKKNESLDPKDKGFVAVGNSNGEIQIHHFPLGVFSSKFSIQTKHILDIEAICTENSKTTLVSAGADGSICFFDNSGKKSKGQFEFSNRIYVSHHDLKFAKFFNSKNQPMSENVQKKPQIQLICGGADGKLTSIKESFFYQQFLEKNKEMSSFFELRTLGDGKSIVKWNPGTSFDSRNIVFHDPYVMLYDKDMIYVLLASKPENLEDSSQIVMMSFNLVCTIDVNLIFCKGNKENRQENFELSSFDFLVMENKGNTTKIEMILTSLNNSFIVSLEKSESVFQIQNVLNLEEKFPIIPGNSAKFMVFEQKDAKYAAILSREQDFIQIFKIGASGVEIEGIIPMEHVFDCAKDKTNELEKLSASLEAQDSENSMINNLTFGDYVFDFEFFAERLLILKRNELIVLKLEDCLNWIKKIKDLQEKDEKNKQKSNEMLPDIEIEWTFNQETEMMNVNQKKSFFEKNCHQFYKLQTVKNSKSSIILFRSDGSLMNVDLLQQKAENLAIPSQNLNFDNFIAVENGNFVFSTEKHVYEWQSKEKTLKKIDLEHCNGFNSIISLLPVQNTNGKQFMVLYHNYMHYFSQYNVIDRKRFGDR